MIVKNEKNVLKRCLDSIVDLVDEIIIVDTGSTDNTIEIAKQYTEKVYDFDWIDDFSAARNYSLSFATGDYIYIADADEVIDEENRNKFMMLKRSLKQEIDIVQMKYANQLEMGTTYNFDVEYRPKLFKRIRTFMFQDPIHETLNTNIITIDSDITIIHKPEKTNQERDFNVFQKVLKKGQLLSPKLHMMYARELFIVGKEEDFKVAYDYFESTLHDDWRSNEEVVQAQCIVARVANLNNDLGELFKTTAKNLIGSPCAEICCEIGDYYLRNNDPEEAATWFYTASFGAQSELNIRYSGDIALNKLSMAFEKLGNQDEAIRYKSMSDNWMPPVGDI